MGAGTVSKLARDERGQVMPLLLVVMIALLGAGMLVFWLGFSTSVATDAQTAADAAALAAEQSVDQQWNTLININGVLQPRASFQPGPVQAAAQQWAGKPNQGLVVSVEYCSQGGGCSPQPIETAEPDVLVTVQSSQKLPAGSISPGAGATAQARASTDPYSQASPSVAQLQTTSTCDPSGVSRPLQYKPPTGQFGFFAAAGTNFDPGCESRLAAHLDALAKSSTPKLHLVGIWGAGATDPEPHANPTPAISAAHNCDAAVEVQGLPASVTATELARWGLTRFPDQPDQIEFLSASAQCATNTTIPNQGTNNLTANVGNGKVHLVPLTGGPQGSGLFGIGAIPGVGPWPAIASYMPIYREVAKQYGWDQAQLQDWLAVEQIEDAGGDLGIASDGAFGLAQFQTVNYCNPAYGPGDCPSDNPTAAQEIASMAKYIHDRYGNPAAALAHELANNPHWY